MTLLDILPSVGRAGPRRFDPAIWPRTTHSDEDGQLCVGGVPLADIADEFRNPALRTRSAFPRRSKDSRNSAKF